MSSFPEALADRFHRFRHRHFVPNAEQYEELATYGQNPEVMLISCLPFGWANLTRRAGSNHPFAAMASKTA